MADDDDASFCIYKTAYNNKYYYTLQSDSQGQIMTSSSAGASSYQEMVQLIYSIKQVAANRNNYFILTNWSGSYFELRAQLQPLGRGPVTGNVEDSIQKVIKMAPRSSVNNMTRC